MAKRHAVRVKGQRERGVRSTAVLTLQLILSGTGIAAAQVAPPVTPPIAVVPGTNVQVTPPTTATGESAPPLTVPPAPALLPPVIPSLPPGAASSVPTAAPITVDQAVAIGLAHQPTVGIAQQNVLEAAARTQQSVSQLGPTLTASAGYNRNVVNAPSNGFGGGNSTTDGVNETLSARQLLFDFQHTADTVRATRAQEAATRAGFSATREDTIFTIRQDYYLLLETQRLIAVQQQNLAAQQAHLDEARAVFSAGRGLESDVYQAQTNVANALLVLATSQNDEALARTSLDVAMGVDPRTPTIAADVPAPGVTLPDLNAMVTTALTVRPEVLQAQDLVTASQDELKADRSQNLPAITANGSIGLSGGSFPGDTTRKSVGIGVSWDIFDSGLTQGRIKEAQAALQVARLQLYQAQQTVSSDVTTAYLNVTNAEQKLITSNAAVANAAESLRLAEGRYRAGVAIFLEVQDAQAALAAAQATQVNNAAAVNIALAALDRAVGRGR